MFNTDCDSCGISPRRLRSTSLTSFSSIHLFWTEHVCSGFTPQQTYRPEVWMLQRPSVPKGNDSLSSPPSHKNHQHIPGMSCYYAQQKTKTAARSPDMHFFAVCHSQLLVIHSFMTNGKYRPRVLAGSSSDSRWLWPCRLQCFRCTHAVFVWVLPWFKH